MSDEKQLEADRRKAKKRVDRRTADVILAAREACKGDFRAKRGDLIDALDDLDLAQAELARLTPQLALDAAPVES
jgi:hypothetical protein